MSALIFFARYAKIKSSLLLLCSIFFRVRRLLLTLCSILIDGKHGKELIHKFECASILFMPECSLVILISAFYFSFLSSASLNMLSLLPSLGIQIWINLI